MNGGSADPILSFCVPPLFKVEQKKQSWFYSREYIFLVNNISERSGPSFLYRWSLLQNWVYEVMFNMFLSVEGVNPQFELERRRQVQGLINNSWRNTKYINAVRLAQLWRAMVCREGGSGFRPQPDQPPHATVFKKTGERWSRRWVVTLSLWPWVEMLQLPFLFK